MSDRRLRELERTWHTSGRVEDEGALLRARLQAGALAPERLELAAWLGHAGARSALGEDAPAGGPPRERWLAALNEEGRRGLAWCARRTLARTLPESQLHSEVAAECLSQLDAWLRGGDAARSDVATWAGAARERYPTPSSSCAASGRAPSTSRGLRRTG